MGLISTFNLLGRTAQLYVHAPAPLRNILQPQIDYFCQEMNYEVILDEIDSTKHQLIYEDRSLEVWSLPLNHRVPCCGFLFKEKPLKKHIIADKIRQYNIPIYAINSIKDSKDYTLPDGTIIPNDQLTSPADPTRSYAYCSDTRYLPQLAEYLQDVDILFHEATFGEDKKNLAFATYHSTAAQAATLAKECHAKKLFIGHYSARYDDENILLNEAREIFPETFLTKEDEIIQI